MGDRRKRDLDAVLKEAAAALVRALRYEAGLEDEDEEVEAAAEETEELEVEEEESEEGGACEEVAAAESAAEEAEELAEAAAEALEARMTVRDALNEVLQKVQELIEGLKRDILDALSKIGPAYAYAPGAKQPAYGYAYPPTEEQEKKAAEVLKEALEEVLEPLQEELQSLEARLAKVEECAVSPRRAAAKAEIEEAKKEEDIMSLPADEIARRALASKDPVERARLAELAKAKFLLEGVK